jgi:predicted RNase H-like HicB family nuclease
MKMDNPSVEKHIDTYTYTTHYSSSDQAYLAQCQELGITAHGETAAEALDEIKIATKVHLLMLIEDEEEIPSPLKLAGHPT